MPSSKTLSKGVSDAQFAAFTEAAERAGIDKPQALERSYAEFCRSQGVTWPVTVFEHGGDRKTGMTNLATLESVARFAAEHKIHDRKRPDGVIDIILNTIERWPREFDEAAVRAAIVTDIQALLYGNAPDKFADISRFVDMWFADILHGVYQGNALKLLQNRKLIKSGYLCYFNRASRTPVR